MLKTLNDFIRHSHYFQVWTLNIIVGYRGPCIEISFAIAKKLGRIGVIHRVPRRRVKLNNYAIAKERIILAVFSWRAVPLEGAERLVKKVFVSTTCTQELHSIVCPRVRSTEWTLHHSFPFLASFRKSATSLQIFTVTLVIS